MELEKEIHQKTFKNEYQKLSINLVYTHNWARDRINSLFRDHDVTPQQYNVLRILRGNYPNPYTTSDIRDRMLDKMSDASRIVDRLVQKGYAERNKCEKDARLVDVLITEIGMKLLDDMETQVAGTEQVFRNLSLKEAASLNKLLDKVRKG